MNARILLIVLLFASGAASADAPDAAHRKMAFMCSWVAAHMPNQVTLQPCDSTKAESVSSADLNAAMASYWQQWVAISNRSRIAAFKAEFEQAYSPPAAHKYTVTEIQSESTPKLCSHVRANGAPAAMALDEIKRRNSLTAAELRLVRAHSIQVGISQTALTCSWGDPEHQNRTVTAAGESIQWIYSEKNYVYTVNGVVTAYQD